MKKIMSVCLMFGLMISLCACTSGQEPAKAACGHEAYSDLIARLEAKDFDGARSIIDILERQENPVATVMVETTAAETPAQEEPTLPPAQPGSVVTADMEIVKLTQYNVNDYFEFVDDYLISERSGCNQYIVLKEEYADRLISAENVRIDVSYLMTNAYGEIDMKAEEFKSEYFDITSKQRMTDTLELDRNNTAWIAQPTYSNRKGCFQDFVMDVEIESGSGTLVFSES